MVFLGNLLGAQLRNYDFCHLNNFDPWRYHNFFLNELSVYLGLAVRFLFAQILSA